VETLRQIPVPSSDRAVNAKENVTEWFADFIQELTVKKIAYFTQTMSDAEARHFEFLSTANEEEIFNHTRELSKIYFSKKIIVEYVKLIRSIPTRTLAFDLSGSEILVWIEIDNNREDIERALILAEASVNAEFYKIGFRIDSVIVEESDHLKIPSHYLTLQTQDSA
jgi:hypothetical protein